MTTARTGTSGGPQGAAGRPRATGGRGGTSGAAGRVYAGADARTRHAERLARLEEAGLDLFATVGYQQTTVADVCERAKVSRRHFYEQFADREALLRHLHTGLQQRGRVAVETALARGMSRVDGLSTTEARRALVLAGVSAYIDAVLTDPRGLRVAFVEVVGVSPEMERYRLDNRAAWAALVRSAVEAVGSRAVAPWVYAAFIPSVNEFLVAWWQRADAGADPTELVEVLSSVLTNLLETASADGN